MTLDPQLISLISQLGIASPFIVLLVMLLKGADSERRDINSKFLSTLETTIKADAESRATVAGALSELGKAVVDNTRMSTQEHQKMVELLQSIDKGIDRYNKP